jgi:hypothetical protein
MRIAAGVLGTVDGQVRCGVVNEHDTTQRGNHHDRPAAGVGPAVLRQPGLENAEPTRYLKSLPELKGRCWGRAVNPFPPERLGTHWTAEKAMRFVEQNQEKPFFLWFSIPDPHIPFHAYESRRIRQDALRAHRRLETGRLCW